MVQKRAEAKDYLDIDVLIQHGIDLPTALAAGRIVYGRSFNPMITLKALSFFDDVPSLPAECGSGYARRLMPSIRPAFPRSRLTSSGQTKTGTRHEALTRTPALLNVARRVIWFKEPEEALADPVHFLAHVMTYGTVEDLKALKELSARTNSARFSIMPRPGSLIRVLGLLEPEMRAPACPAVADPHRPATREL